MYFLHIILGPLPTIPQAEIQNNGLLKDPTITQYGHYYIQSQHTQLSAEEHDIPYKQNIYLVWIVLVEKLMMVRQIVLFVQLSQEWQTAKLAVPTQFVWPVLQPIMQLMPIINVLCVLLLLHQYRIVRHASAILLAWLVLQQIMQLMSMLNALFVQVLQEWRTVRLVPAIPLV